MAGDDRFVRTDRSTWGLRSWAVEEYTSIREQIARHIGAEEGAAPLEQVVATITSRFRVSAASVHAYASSGEFEVIDGLVRRRTALATSRKSPADTRRLFRHDDVWRLRITITREHLRGSGFPVPAGLATLLGCRPGDMVQLDSRLGAQVVRWTGPQPTSGTIRRFLEGNGVVEGHSAFLDFMPERRFDVALAPEPNPSWEPVRHALALIGAPEATDLEDAHRVLAEAVGLPAIADQGQILNAYRRRGDDDVTEVLEHLWAPHEITADDHRR
jgi:hypothetical protein